MPEICIQYFKSPAGELILGSYNGSLCLCDWRYRMNRKAIDERIRNTLQADYIETESTIILKAAKQLYEYFNSTRKEFDIPLLMTGTDFQKKVWGTLLEIQYGQTITYLELARKLGDEKLIRAVASANGANAISILIPCHRVLGRKGELTGYAGGLDAKRMLLQLETASLNPGMMLLF